jgi:hypothetical protein
MLKRLDQLIYEPPEEAKEVSLKKLRKGHVLVKCPARGLSVIGGPPCDSQRVCELRSCGHRHCACDLVSWRGICCC